MVALNAGLIFGSYPYVSSFPLTVIPKDNWYDMPFHGNEWDHLDPIEDDAKILSRQPVRFQTMPYVVHGRPTSVHQKSKSKKNSMKNEKVHMPKHKNLKNEKKKSGSDVKPKVKSLLTFGSIPVQQMLIDELHDMLINHLEVKVLPTLRIEPSHTRKKLNKELCDQFHHDIAVKIATVVKNMVNEINPTILLDAALKNASGSKVPYHNCCHKNFPKSRHVWSNK